jgi:hypothetical protein
VSGPDGRKFPWGTIRETHEIGPYSIVEFADRAGDVAYHVYVACKDASVSAWTLDGALLLAIAKRAGDTGAAKYMARLIGIHD